MSTTAVEAGTSTPSPWLKAVVLIVTLPIAVCLMLLAFLAPALHSGAEDLPLAVAGPAPAVEQLTGALEERSPGAFELTEYDDAGQAEPAVADRKAIGAVALDRQGVEITKASGAGAPYGGIMDGLATGLRAQGQEVSVQDVAPLAPEDPDGSALGALALPLAFGGMISAVVFTTQFKSRTVLRAASVLAFSAVAGSAVAWILQAGLHALDGSAWELAGVLAFGIAAISLTITGLESVLGIAGLGIGAVLMMFVANPLSGIAAGWQWLPQPWGGIGQLMPIGAAGTAVRSVAFFDGAGMNHALIVLTCWSAAGLILIAMSALRRHRPRRVSSPATTRSA